MEQLNKKGWLDKGALTSCFFVSHPFCFVGFDSISKWMTDKDATQIQIQCLALKELEYG